MNDKNTDHRGFWPKVFAKTKNADVGGLSPQCLKILEEASKKKRLLFKSVAGKSKAEKNKLLWGHQAVEVQKIIDDPSDENCWNFVLDNPHLVIYALGFYKNQIPVDDTAFMNGLYGFYLGAKHFKKFYGWITYSFMHIAQQLQRTNLFQNSQLSPLFKSSKKTPAPKELTYFGNSQMNHVYPEKYDYSLAGLSVDGYMPIERTDEASFLRAVCRTVFNKSPFFAENLEGFNGVMPFLLAKNPKERAEAVAGISFKSPNKYLTGKMGEKNRYYLLTKFRRCLRSYVSSNKQVEEELQIALLNRS